MPEWLYSCVEIMSIVHAILIPQTELLGDV